MSNNNSTLKITIPEEASIKQIINIYTAINRCYIEIEKNNNENEKSNKSNKEYGLYIKEIKKGSYILVLVTKTAIDCIPQFVNLIDKILKGNLNEIKPAVRDAFITLCISLLCNSLSIRIDKIDLSIDIIKQMLFSLISLKGSRPLKKDTNRVKDLIDKLE